MFYLNWSHYAVHEYQYESSYPKDAGLWFWLWVLNTSQEFMEDVYQDQRWNHSSYEDNSLVSDEFLFFFVSTFKSNFWNIFKMKRKQSFHLSIM